MFNTPQNASRLRRIVFPRGGGGIISRKITALFARSSSSSRMAAGTRASCRIQHLVAQLVAGGDAITILKFSPLPQYAVQRCDVTPEKKVSTSSARLLPFSGELCGKEGLISGVSSPLYHKERTFSDDY